jgi:hypothetical protein
MRVSIRLLGLDLLDVEISTDGEQPSPDTDLSGGTSSSYPIGFTPSPGDQRYEFHKMPDEL